VPQWYCPVQKRFSNDKWRQGSRKLGLLIVGSSANTIIKYSNEQRRLVKMFSNVLLEMIFPDDFYYILGDIIRFLCVTSFVLNVFYALCLYLL